MLRRTRVHLKVVHQIVHMIASSLLPTDRFLDAWPDRLRKHRGRLDTGVTIRNVLEMFLDLRQSDRHFASSLFRDAVNEKNGAGRVRSAQQRLRPDSCRLRKASVR